MPIIKISFFSFPVFFWTFWSGNFLDVFKSSIGLRCDLHASYHHALHTSHPSPRPMSQWAWWRSQTPPLSILPERQSQRRDQIFLCGLVPLISAGISTILRPCCDVLKSVSGWIPFRFLFCFLYIYFFTHSQTDEKTETCQAQRKCSVLSNLDTEEQDLKTFADFSKGQIAKVKDMRFCKNKALPFYVGLDFCSFYMTPLTKASLVEDSTFSARVFGNKWIPNVLKFSHFKGEFNIWHFSVGGWLILRKHC